MKTSIAKHTPGPWIVDGRPSSTVIYSDEPGRSREICKVTPRLQCDDGKQAVLYSDALSPKETDDETVLQYLRSLVAKAEPNAEAPQTFPQGRYASKERGGV